MITKSPVLFLIFNRPDTTKLVFEQIRLAEPPRLYIAADGPRINRVDELALCEETRSILNLIDWNCEVKTLFRETNLGCKYAVSSSIDWFFQNEEEGIILEDDCLPNNDFFVFCDRMLEMYRYDSRIRHITGCNLQNGKKWTLETYYFSNNTHVWGWASWRRAWKDYNVELENYKIDEIEYQLSKIFDEQLLIDSWLDIFKRLKQGQINTWDYQLTLTNYFNNGLSLIPNYNLISNIGFRPDGTHVFHSNNKLANVPLEKLPTDIVHPKYFLPEKLADLYTLYQDFEIGAKKKRDKKIKNRIKKWLKLIN